MVGQFSISGSVLTSLLADAADTMARRRRRKRRRRRRKRNRGRRSIRRKKKRSYALGVMMQPREESAEHTSDDKVNSDSNLLTVTSCAAH